MGNSLPKRQSTRLKEFDYSTSGAYFLTICTSKRINYFWQDHGELIRRSDDEYSRFCSQNVGAAIGRPQNIELSSMGKIVDEAINNIPLKYPDIILDRYVIMPDHIHLLLIIQSNEKYLTKESGRPVVAPTMSRVVQQFKGYITKNIGFSIWQKLFFDHVIRNKDDYEKHVKYIYENPMRWYYKHR